MHETESDIKRGYSVVTRTGMTVWDWVCQTSAGDPDEPRRIGRTTTWAERCYFSGAHSHRVRPGKNTKT